MKPSALVPGMTVVVRLPGDDRETEMVFVKRSPIGEQRFPEYYFWCERYRDQSGGGKDWNVAMSSRKVSTSVWRQAGNMSC